MDSCLSIAFLTRPHLTTLFRFQLDKASFPLRGVSLVGGQQPLGQRVSKSWPSYPPIWPPNSTYFVVFKAHLHLFICMDFPPRPFAINKDRYWFVDRKMLLKLKLHSALHKWMSVLVIFTNIFLTDERSICVPPLMSWYVLFIEGVNVWNWRRF